MLYQLRNMWQFANVGQFIFTFAEPLKLQNFDIEDLEMESLKPGAPKLKEIGLAFLKFATWQRGLSLDNFDDITRKLFAAHTRGPNPFGTNEDPVHFNDFDVKTKIKALQTLSALTMRNPDRLRELMDATKEKSDQTYWVRINLAYTASLPANIFIAR